MFLHLSSHQRQATLPELLLHSRTHSRGLLNYTIEKKTKKGGKMADTGWFGGTLIQVSCHTLKALRAVNIGLDRDYQFLLSMTSRYR